MALRISHIKIEGKIVRGKDLLKLGRNIETVMANMGVECKVSVNWVYSDRWISLDEFQRRIL